MLVSGNHEFETDQILIHGDGEWRPKGRMNTQSDLEFSLQTATASSRRGGIELGKVGLQWGHLQLGVPIQVVLQQSLEDEHVLHLWGKKRWWRTSGTQLNAHHQENRGHTYISLDHLTPLSSDPGDEAKHVHLPLSDHHVQHSINHNESTRPPHASTDRDTKVELKTSTWTCSHDVSDHTRLPAMHHDGSSILGVAILHFFKKLEHANGSERHSKVWPAGEVKLGDKPLRFLPRHVSHLKHNHVRSKRASGNLLYFNSNLGH